MAKWGGKSTHSVELVEKELLPDYAKKFAGRVVGLVGVQFLSSEVPFFTTPDCRLEGNYYLHFREHHVKQFIYEAEVLLNIDVDCECSEDDWRVSAKHNPTCPCYEIK